MWKKLLLAGAVVMLTACQSTDAIPTPVPMVPTLSATSAVALQPTAVAVESSEPIAPDVAGIPVRLAAPALQFAVPVETMSWQVTEVEGARKAVWEVPETSAGWHLNSARPGTAGNTVISGHHLLGAAVFAPIARGEFTVGTDLLLSDDQGRTFLYRVREIGQPIPVTGGTKAEQEQAIAYLAATDQAMLTLITGWPDFSDTHYLFIQAEFVGSVQ